MRLGFIGLGNIGREIAAALAASGHGVRVCDLSEAAVRAAVAKGCVAAPSPRAVAEQADKIGVCVQDDAQVREVMEAVLAGARPGLLVLVHSTVGIDTVRDLATRAAQAGVRVVDAPVSRTGAGGMVFMVGGEPADVAAARPYLALCATKVVETGALGTAMTLKICNNVLTYLQVCAAQDVLRLARAGGLEAQHLAALTSANGIASPFMTRTFERDGQAFSHAETDVGAAIARMGKVSEKDLDCALEAARALGVELPSAVMARVGVRAAIAAGFGEP